MSDKDRVAEDLIDWHFRSEPGIVIIYRIISDNETEPDEPIKLVELNTATVSTGMLEAFRFAPTAEVPYPTVLAELTPEEFDILLAEERFPPTWDLSRARRYERPAA